MLKELFVLLSSDSAAFICAIEEHCLHLTFLFCPIFCSKDKFWSIDIF